MPTTDEPGGDALDRRPWTHLTAEVVEYPDEPAECTIYPGDAPSTELLTTWVSARAGSFVNLAEMR